MNGTKWYKLNKSNEPIVVTLHEELRALESAVSSDLSSALTTVAEIVFSGLLTYFIGKEEALRLFYWQYIGVEPSKSQILWGTVSLCSIVFLGTIGICKLLTFIVGKVKTTFKDEKKNLVDIYELERYFYQKVLNDIITGVSLEKKSCELLAEIDSSASPVQDKNLSSIYLVEAVFYFHEATRSIAERHVFEVPNKKRKEYTEYLKAINSGVVCNIFLSCENTLERIIGTLEADVGQTGNEQTVISAKKAFNLFVDYRSGIHKQLALPPVETQKFKIPEEREFA